MEAGKYYDFIVVGGEQNAIREATKQRSTDRSVDERVLERVPLDSSESSVHRAHELAAEAWATLSVPFGRFSDLEVGLRSDDEASAHP